jgi:hypothetical protein
MLSKWKLVTPFRGDEDWLGFERVDACAGSAAMLPTMKPTASIPTPVAKSLPAALQSMGGL